MNDKLRETLNKINVLSEQNHEFAEELRKMVVKKSPSAIAVSNNEVISEDIKAIREALEIRASNSLSYEFVQSQRFRDQLIIDNLRMENVALSLKLEGNERFIKFCTNAFYQVEGIINYYLHKTYPDINVLLNFIVENTKDENEKFQFTPKGDEKYVTDIPMAHKINSVCKTLLSGDISLKITLGQLRIVRNDKSHRGTSDNKNKSFTSFIEYNNISTIRNSLKKLVTAIEQEFKPVVKECTISSILPSGCFVKTHSGSVEQLPQKLLSHIKSCNQGDIVKIEFVNGVINDIVI